MRLVTLMAILALCAVAGCSSGPQEQPEPTPDERASSSEQAPEEQTKEGTEETSDDAARESVDVALVGEPQVEGPGELSTSALREVAEKRQRRTASCFQSLPGDLEQPSRQVLLTIRLSADGAVLEVQSSADDEFGECVAAEVGRWDFPKPRGGEVESTLEFKYEAEQE